METRAFSNGCFPLSKRCGSPHGTGVPAGASPSGVSSKGEDGPPKGGTPNGIMHCFGGTPQMAIELMNIGFYISFAGNVTFKKAENLRDAARVVPLDKLLVETDCPFLTPVPFRGKRNEPAFVEHTARFLAELYGVDLENLAAKTTQNFLDLFQIKLATNFTNDTN